MENWRPFLLVCHRWLGLGSSVLLAVIGITGTAYLFPVSESVHLVLEQLHVSLMIPGVGAAIVIAATVAALLLQLSGLYLWWKRKRWAVRWRSGWRLVAYDLHHLTGAMLLVIMLLLAGTGLGRVAVRQVLPPWSRAVNGVNALHTGLRFPTSVKVVYAAGGLGFLVQGITGVLMWWPRSRSARATVLRVGD